MGEPFDWADWGSESTAQLGPLRLIACPTGYWEVSRRHSVTSITERIQSGYWVPPKGGATQAQHLVRAKRCAEAAAMDIHLERRWRSFVRLLEALLVVGLVQRALEASDG